MRNPGRPTLPNDSGVSATVIALDPLIPRIGEALTAREIGWAVAGGWAIDLFLGRVTRPHADVDLAVWRDQHQQLREAMPRWHFSIADAGQLRPWLPGTLVAPPLHEIHATSVDDRSRVEFLLNDRREGMWLYRRNPNVRLPLADAVLDARSTPFLAPEIVLLYKSKEPRATDEADFHNALPQLSTNARQWLSEALSLTNASHPWLAMLRASKD
jgi:aminoglycoside-2''-adenylyltransferase